MTEYPVPENEAGRLSALNSFEILDTLPEDPYDGITKIISEVCQVPIALVSLIDGKRQWFKSKIGLDIDETPRSISFCQYAIMNHSLFTVEDAQKDSRFRDNPLVMGFPKIRFYAGMPLRTSGGFNIGTLCVIDSKPRKLTSSQKDALTALASQVINLLELKKANLDLEKSQKTISNFFRLSLDLLCIADKNGYFININPSFEKILGYSEKTLLERPFIDFVHPDDIKGTMEVLGRLSKGDDCTDFVNRYRKSSGEYIYISWHATTDMDTGLIYAAARDITEEMKHSREIHDLNFALEQSAIVARTDHRGIITYVDDNFCRISKYAREELLGKNHRIVNSGYHSKDVFRKMWETITSGKVWKGEIKNKAKDGTYYWVDATIVPLRDVETNRQHYIAVRYEITDKKEYEEKLKETNDRLNQAIRFKDIFLANMSHEIRTPMNAIIGFSNLLSNTGLTDEQNEYLHSITVASKNLLVIINDILDLSKIEAGKITLENEVISLKEILESAIKFSEQKAVEKGIEIILRIDKKIPTAVRGDSVRLTQILVNLISNAVKFTEKGRVEISADVEFRTGLKADIIFRVKDTGIGIPPEKIETVFERFEQASASTSRRYGGTGLGLSIVKMLVELHKGTIDVESAEGKGSSFSFRISYSVADESHLLKAYTMERQRSRILEGLHILVAEDNELNQKLVTKYLTGQGASVKLAINGIKCLELLHTARFDVILMDLHMPDMDGYETTKTIRNSYRIPIPIIACTADTMAGEKEKCFEVGMNGYISKPYSEEELVISILTACSA